MIFKMGSKKQFCVLMILLALCTSSCRTGRRNEHRILYDSILVKEIRTQTHIPVPMSKVELKVPQTSMYNLPDGAGYIGKNERAGIVVRKQGDTITITATCDSLQQIVMNYEVELTRLHQELETLEQVTPCTPTGWQWFWTRVGQLAVIFLLIRVIIFTDIKKIRK